MNNAITTVDSAVSTWALFGCGQMSPKSDVSVSISEAGMAAYNQAPSASADAIIPANGMNETLKAALLCMLLG
jgi:hypothetical protein